MRRAKLIDDFWFEAQTGCIYHEQPAAPSNYHRYRLPARCLARVKLTVEAAALGSAGLCYEPAFLAWLEAHDAS